MRVHALTQLIGEVYEVAPSAVRNVMIEHLVRPLGVLSLATVANGVFLDGLLRDRLLGSHISEAPQNIEISDVIALAERVQQIKAEVIDEVVEVVRTWQDLAGCAAAATLAKMPFRQRSAS